MDLILKAFAILMAIILFLAIASIIVAWKKPDKSAPLKGLNLPEGSIRSILALMSVGSFLVFLVVGCIEGKLQEGRFEQVVTAFGPLTGAIIGFYFGSRSGNNTNTHNSK